MNRLKHFNFHLMAFRLLCICGSNYNIIMHVLKIFPYTYTVNSEIFARISFSRIAFKDILATIKNCDQAIVYLYQQMTE